MHDHLILGIAAALGILAISLGYFYWNVQTAALVAEDATYDQYRTPDLGSLDPLRQEVVRQAVIDGAREPSFDERVDECVEKSARWLDTELWLETGER